MAVEVKEKKKDVQENQPEDVVSKIIYIPKNLKSAYIKYFEGDSGQVMADLINSLVTLIGELHTPEQCSLEPSTISQLEGTMEMKLKIVRPEVKITSENGLFITVRDFYTEHKLKFRKLQKNSIDFTVAKSVKGCVLKPTTAQVLTNYMHSHLHSSSYKHKDAYNPQSFCLGNSALSSSLYGNKVVRPEYIKPDISNAMKYFDKILHYSEALVHYESISGVPYMNLKGVIDKSWLADEGDQSLNLKPSFTDAYYRSIQHIYGYILDTGKLPFILKPGKPWYILGSSNGSIIPNTHDTFPVIEFDEKMKDDFIEIAVQSTSHLGSSQLSHSTYIFDNRRYGTKLYKQARCSDAPPEDLYVGNTHIEFKGKYLRSSWAGVYHDEHPRQTTPVLAGTESETGDQGIPQYIGTAFTEAFSGIMTTLLSSFYMNHRLVHNVPGTHLSLTITLRTLSSSSGHNYVITDVLSTTTAMGRRLKIMLFTIAGLIKNTINFNNFNRLINE